MRLLRVPLRYNVCNRRIIDTYRWHDRRTFYMSPVLLKCRQTRLRGPCPRGNTSRRRFPHRSWFRSMDARAGFSGDVRCWNFWKYAERQTKCEPSCPRQSVDRCFKALTFSIFKTGVELHGRVQPIACVPAFVSRPRTHGLICRIANGKKLGMIKKPLIAMVFFSTVARIT